MSVLKIIKSKKILLLSIILILLSSVASYTYFSGKQSEEKNQNQNDSFDVISTNEESLEVFGEFSNEDTNSINVLLLGYGGAGHSGGFLADAIQVVHFDFENLKISLISVPRDLWVELPNGISSKVNQAFSLGNKTDPINSGAKISAAMIETVTGLKINHYISIDFVGFKRAVGYVLNGLEVNVPVTLDDPWYPISGNEQDPCGKSPEEIASLSSQYSGFELERQFECRYEHIHFDKGTNFMEGGDALAYVRSRHGSAGGDFDRSQRQQALLLAIRDKLFELDALTNIPGFFKQMIQHTNTSLDVETIKSLAPMLAKSKDIAVKNITLSTSNVFSSSKSSNGQYIIVPKSGLNNWNEVHEFVASELSN